MDVLEIFALLVAGGLAVTFVLGAMLLIDRRAPDEPDRSNPGQRVARGPQPQSAQPFGSADEQRLP